MNHMWYSYTVGDSATFRKNVSNYLCWEVTQQTPNYRPEERWDIVSHVFNNGYNNTVIRHKERLTMSWTLTLKQQKQPQGSEQRTAAMKAMTETEDSQAQ